MCALSCRARWSDLQRADKEPMEDDEAHEPENVVCVCYSKGMPDLLTFLHIYYRAGFQDNYMVRYLLGLRNVEHVVTASADYAFSVFAADVDDAGSIDVLSASMWDNTVALYENDGAESFAEHEITTLAVGAHDDVHRRCRCDDVHRRCRCGRRRHLSLGPWTARRRKGVRWRRFHRQRRR